MILKVMLDFDFEGYAGILVALKVMLGFDAVDDNAGIFTILIRDFDGFEGDAGILTILILDFDVFEGAARF